MRIATWSILAAAAILVSGGCGSSRDQPELGKVTGTVTMDGSPLAGVIVNFSPASGRTSQGVTDGSGKYELIYAHDTMGAQVGEHTVHISSQGGAEGGGNPNEETGGGSGTEFFTGTIPAKYNQQSTLTATVEPGKNIIDFELESGGAAAAPPVQKASP